MPRFRRYGIASVQKNPESSFKVIAAVIVIVLYLLIKEFSSPKIRTKTVPTYGAHIQFAEWQNGTEKGDPTKAEKVRNAMKYTFWKYRENAWGYDDIKPVSGGNATTRNGWGAFIVDSSTTLALMGLWEELAASVQHIISIDFTNATGPVDPFETTIRYLGGLVSLVDLSDAGLIPTNIINPETREILLRQATTLAMSLGPAYDTPTGMPWPRVNFSTSLGEPDPPSVYLENPDKPRYKNPVIGPARTGSAILENRVLTRLTGDAIYTINATKAWAPLVWNQWLTPWAGMVDAPFDIVTGEPVGRQRHWDGGHDSYYEYLLKVTLLSPPHDPYIDDYKKRFLEAAYSLRTHLASRSAPAEQHMTQHLFIAKQDAQWLINKQGHLACFAPGTLLLGSKYLDQRYLRTFALALLEGCHHAYTSSPSKIGPEAWSWLPKFGYGDAVHQPFTERSQRELATTGIWMTDPHYKLRPEYVESLFYAWRITGDLRYRDWAWEMWVAIEKYCKTDYGFAGLRDVGKVEEMGGHRWIDEQQSFWGAETLKYMWLVFSDTKVADLDQWVFSTEGHLFRMIR
ncbi:seven-hairpin glycosidase [Delitschia confertaspora ATCC 74209]|uniref:alpha-1,2-Mannosidase n=1 Tax=Delitschia confertaspora ATCC 74209 TaxID=1513339 RepID=A0A9P4JL15_9PLEO|nr:seven-hairpin glycosidase [Delitschia confertaspora ATCC 74209]